MAYDTHTVDTRAGWERAERGGIKGDPGGSRKRDHAAVSPWAEAVSTMGALIVLSILTSGTVSVTIILSRRWFNSAEDLNGALHG